MERARSESCVASSAARSARRTPLALEMLLAGPRAPLPAGGRGPPHACRRRPRPVSARGRRRRRRGRRRAALRHATTSPASAAGGAGKGFTLPRRRRPTARRRRDARAHPRPRHPAGLDRRVDLPDPPTATSRPPAATPAAASSTATTRAGARCATRRSSTACCEFGEALPALRAGESTRDLAAPGLPREKVLATVVRLLETHLHPRRQRRVRRRATAPSASPRCATATSTFDGGDAALPPSRQGRQAARRSALERPPLAKRRARAARTCPASELFQYSTTTARRSPSTRPTSTTTCARSPARTSPPRTSAPGWASVHALARAARGACEPSSSARPRRACSRPRPAWPTQLGNTRAVTRKFYVHPGLQQEYLEGRLIARLARLRKPRPVAGLSGDEALLLALLRTF